MTEWLQISDGSNWPVPALESDEEYGVEHTLRYGNPTRGDLLTAASIISAYGYLLIESTQAKRDLVCREIRAAAERSNCENAGGVYITAGMFSGASCAIPPSPAGNTND